MDFADLIQAYALDPTPEGLTRLQDAIRTSPGYDPMVSVAVIVTPLKKNGDSQGIVDAIWKQMPGIFLSPSAHAELAAAYQELGDEDASRRERAFTKLALDSLAASGAGTEDDPCRVLRIEDEYDVLGVSQLKSVGQEQVIDERGAFDVHTLEDGEKVWFRLLWREQRAGAGDDTAAGPAGATEA